jgi:hypothetical protein
MRTDKAHQRRGLARFERADKTHVVTQRGRASVDDDEIVRKGGSEHVLEAHAVRWRIDQPAVRNKCRGLSQPRRVPERFDLAPRLVARAGPAVKASEGR